ncbi:MAG: hypothetical protein KJN84_10720, partial [Bacteroidia bacterium]|nr:hypothetical protein [Bacteroidia bacterium]
MAKILATKITLIESTDSPHVEDGKNTCYFQDDLDIIKGKANFHCFSYYKIEKIDDETIEDDLTVILGIDS